MYKSAFIISLSLLLSACGGSGGNEKNTDIKVPPITPTQPTLDHSGLSPLTFDIIDPLEYKPGGDATLFISNEDAFSTRPRAIADDFQLDGHFTSGDHLFRTPDNDIGPLLNTGSCQGCHLNDGRGVVPNSPTDPMSSMLVKIADSSGKADPIYGDQIQPFAVQSFNTDDFTSGFSKHDGSVSGAELYGEAFPFIEYEIIQGTYPDGATYELRNPIYKVRDLSYGAFVENIHFSARIAPQAFGVGLLGAIPQENLLALVDESDRDNDGISGRASMVKDVLTNEEVIGRFAYKAQNPTVLQQVAGAYNGDMGVSTSIFSAEPCTDQQIACHLAAEQESKIGVEVDLSDHSLALVEFYNRVLGVPARRGYDTENKTWSEDIRQGRELFFKSNCTGCHTPRHITAEAKGSALGEITLAGLTENAEPVAVLSHQTIFPYTDLLLHDMGGSCQVTRETSEGLSCSSGAECHYVQRCEGLADGVLQGDASGSEWKTPALWGIGLVQTVNANSTFLHDGRARTIEEAILWHGGEAEKAKGSFMDLSATERDQLLSFLQSL
jgi:CxxC motif-containing protein (DUF1111 family)